MAGVLASVAAIASLAAQAGPKISPRDTLNIQVTGVDDLTKNYVVAGDGSVDFPWASVGRVQAGGMTAKAFEAALTEKLKCCVRAPQVSVTLQQLIDKEVIVTGSVQSQGPIAYGGEITLFQALSRAVPTADAGDTIFVSRKQPDGTVDVAAQVSLSELRGNMIKYDVPLHDGDIVQVPQAQSVYVLGYVNQPGAVTVPAHCTLNQLLALVHGATEMANVKGATVLHYGEKKWAKLKDTDIIKPGDTVKIPKRFF